MTQYLMRGFLNEYNNVLKQGITNPSSFLRVFSTVYSKESSDLI